MVENFIEEWEKRKEEKALLKLDQEEKEIIELEEPDPAENDEFYTPDSDSKWDVLYKKRLDQEIEKVKNLYPDDTDRQQKELKDYRKRADIEQQYSKQLVGGIFDAVDSAANFTINRWLPEDYKINLPDIEPPENIKQGLVRGGAQFMVPFLGWFGALSKGYKLLKGGKKAANEFKKSWAADFGLASAAGAITDVVHFKAEDPTLSNLIQQYPHLQNPVTNFLQTDPDDTESLNRFKRAVEGFGLGSLFPVIFRGVGKGFSYTREKATERIIKSTVDATDLNLTPQINQKTGKPIRGNYHARVGGNEIFVDRNSATKKWDVTINNKRAWSYDRLSDAKKGIDNLLNHRTNLDEGLKGKHRKLVDTKEPLFPYMGSGLKEKTFTQRLNDFFRGRQILDYFAMKVFDQYHGSKLLGREVFSGKLTPEGLRKLGSDQYGGYKEIRLRQGAAGIMEAMLKHGQIRWNKGKGQFETIAKNRKSLREILSPVDKDIRTFMQYWAASRLMNIQKQVEPAKFVKVKGEPDEFVPGVYIKDEEKIKRLWGDDKKVELAFRNAAGLGTKRAKNGKLWSEILDEVDEFNDSILDFAKASGIIDDIQLDKLRASPHFIPFYREFADEAGNSARIFGGGGLGSVLSKQFKGAPIGESGLRSKITKDKKKIPNNEGVPKYPLKDLVEGYLENMFNIIKNAERNRVMLLQIAHIEELIRQNTIPIARRLKAEKVEELGRNLNKKETAKINRLAKKEAAKDIGEKWAEKVPRKMQRIKVDLESGNIKGQFEDAGIDISNLEDLVFFSPKRLQLGEREFMVTKLVGGKRKLEIWRVSPNQPFLFESFNALYDRQVKYLGKLMSFSSKFKGLLTRGVTYDPGFFMWANFIRDTASAAILSKNKFNIPVYSSLGGLLKQWRKNPVVKDRDGKVLKNADGSDMRYQDMWHEFVMNGGSFGSTLLRTNINENALKRLYKEMNIPYDRVLNKASDLPIAAVKAPLRAGGKIIRGYEDVVSTFEYATRFQEYTQLRRRGVGAREAAYQAREIATDFGMHGTSHIITFLTRQVPFLNAGLQGLYRSARAFEGLTKAEKIFVGSKITTALTVPTLYFRYLNHGNKDYDQLPQHVRDMNYVVPLSPDKWGKPIEERFLYIPKPFEWGAMATILDRAWDWLGPQAIVINGKKISWLEGKEDFTWDDFVAIASKVVSEQLRLDIIPQVVSPWVDLALNKRFTGSAIVPEWVQQSQEKNAQYYPWSNAAIATAWDKYNLGVTGLSAIQFEYLLKGYTGAMGQYFLDFMVDPPFRGDDPKEDIMFTAPRIETDPALVPGKKISPWIFKDWNKVPLLKRIFSVGPHQHTQNILDAYKLQNEISTRVDTLAKFEKGPEANPVQFEKLIEDPYTQDILLLDKTLATQFDMMSEISKKEKELWGYKEADMTPEKKGDALRELRIRKAEIADSIMEALKGMDLEYVMPKIFTIPLTHHEVNLFKLVKDLPKVREFLFPGAKGEKKYTPSGTNLTYEQMLEYY